MHNQKRLRFVLTFVECRGVATGRYLARAFAWQSKNGGKRFVCAIRSAEHEASKWIARLNADDVSLDDSARFEAWRKLHPRHARASEELFATWRNFTAAKAIDGT